MGGNMGEMDENGWKMAIFNGKWKKNERKMDEKWAKMDENERKMSKNDKMPDLGWKHGNFIEFMGENERKMGENGRKMGEIGQNPMKKWKKKRTLTIAASCKKKNQKKMVKITKKYVIF
jgi:hypothetical protein